MRKKRVGAEEKKTAYFMIAPATVLIVLLGIVDEGIFWLGKPFLTLNCVILVDTWRMLPMVTLMLLAANGVGSLRYGYIRNCKANGTVNTSVNGSGAIEIYEGSILGGFDRGIYGMIAHMISPELKDRYVSDCETDNQDLPFVGADYENTDTAVYHVENNQVTN